MPFAFITDCVVWGNTDEATGPESADQVYARNDASVDVTISYSDIYAAAGNIYDPGVRINILAGTSFFPGMAGNISDDPLFVTGPDGGYYLSQTASGQGADSPCMDTGSDTAVNLGLDTPTTRTDEVTDAAQVDMGYHYEP